MRLVLKAHRRKVDMAGLAMADALWTGKPMHIVASTRELAECTFAAAQSLNGRDPQEKAPG